MSGLLSTTAVSPFDSVPSVLSAGGVNVNELPANTVFNHTIDIGPPTPNRRILAFNISDYFSTSPTNPTLVQTCKFNGVTAERVGLLLDGFVVSNRFSRYILRPSAWTSHIVSEGTTASVELSCTARTNWKSVGFLVVNNLSFPSATFGLQTANSSMTINDIPSGRIHVFLCSASSISGGNSATSVTNTEFIFRGNNNADYGPTSAFFYQNRSRLSTPEPSVTFTANQGWNRVLFFWD